MASTGNRSRRKAEGGRIMADLMKIPDEEISGWYNSVNRAITAAMEDAARQIGELFDVKLTPEERRRVRITAKRIKGATQLLNKIKKPYFLNQINSIDDISRIIPDIIGIRIVCSNKNLVTRIVKIIEEEILTDTDNHNSLTAPNYSESPIADYVTNPHSTGYRAIHIVIGVQSGASGKFFIFNCEVQIRTLLQDAWGELSRADFYNTVDVPLPNEVLTYSRHLAEILAANDGLVDSLVDAVSQASSKLQPPNTTVTPITTLNESPLTAVIERVENERLFLLLQGGRKGIVHVDDFRSSSEIPIDLTQHFHPEEELTVEIIRQDETSNQLMCKILKRNARHP